MGGCGRLQASRHPPDEHGRSRLLFTVSSCLLAVAMNPADPTPPRSLTHRLLRSLAALWGWAKAPFAEAPPLEGWGSLVTSARMDREVRREENRLKRRLSEAGSMGLNSFRVAILRIAPGADLGLEFEAGLLREMRACDFMSREGEGAWRLLCPDTHRSGVDGLIQRVASQTTVTVTYVVIPLCEPEAA